VEALVADIIVAWIAAFLTLMIFSFLYRDNPFYKFAEHLFVGVSVAYYMVFGFWSTLVPNLFGKVAPAWTARTFDGMGIGLSPNATPEPIYGWAAVLGLLMLARLVHPIAWLSRLSLAFIVGWAAGTNLTRFVQSDFIAQIDNTIGLVAGTPASFVPVLTTIIVVAGVLAGLVYFFFSAPHKGVLGHASRVGIWVLMITFGASFGYTVMARISLLTGRLDDLFTVIRHPRGPF
jgi:hypothetical protein